MRELQHDESGTVEFLDAKELQCARASGKTYSSTARADSAGRAEAHQGERSLRGHHDDHSVLQPADDRARGSTLRGSSVRRSRIDDQRIKVEVCRTWRTWCSRCSSSRVSSGGRSPSAAAGRCRAALRILNESLVLQGRHVQQVPRLRHGKVLVGPQIKMAKY